ncbi:hypothetical protein [Saezia sanguinis]|uniref:hypothetical protein n=1 Tax=Saezia sanguinis TaxID=1965230 RepID=UPI003024EF2A
MKTYAVVKDGVVVNLVVWDGKSQWRPDEGKAIALGAEDIVDIGYVYEDGKFIKGE